MNDSKVRAPDPANEPALDFAPGSAERSALEAELDRMRKGGFDIPLVIGGREIRTGRTAPLRQPHDRNGDLGVFHQAGEAEAVLAADAALAARDGWAALPWEERAAVFLRAADLVTGKYRMRLLAATMLGQSKTVQQAEIDAVCETADFFRWNVRFLEQLREWQPESGPGEWNRLSYRPLEGFVYAVSPFNFTSIAANLPTAPALAGNAVVWKPASTSVLSNWVLAEIYREAGLPPGVINFVPGSGAALSRVLLSRREFAGLHFTGSNEVFDGLWRGIAEGLAGYRSYPRIVGETGGKDFVLIDPSADTDTATAAVIRGAYEYQGQKCSAASRLYVPRSRRDEILDRLADEIRGLPQGPVTDFRNFLSAVIDQASCEGILARVRAAAAVPGTRILAGGEGDTSEGWFLRPTLILTEDPKSETMVKELFGPVLTAFVYDDRDMEAVYRLIDGTSPYALTGAVLAEDRGAIVRALGALGNSAGNLYVNDKPTGAVVGRQPFGGARRSGTNDKAGSPWNLLRWTSPLTVKENLDPPGDWRYPHMSGG